MLTLAVKTNSLFLINALSLICFLHCEVKCEPGILAFLWICEQCEHQRWECVPGKFIGNYMSHDLLFLV